MVICKACGTQVEDSVVCPICSFETGYELVTQEEPKPVDEVFREQGDTTFITDFDGDGDYAVQGSCGE